MEKSAPIKIALPKGKLMAETASLLERADWGLNAYHEGTHSYRLTSQRFPKLLAKMFHEKDIPIQVAVGNYDLGICRLDWVEELLVKYPSSALIRLRDLGYGTGALYIVASRAEETLEIEEMQTRKGIIRLASEYPNLAESFALNLRLRRFSVFPLWGAAEVYPPESADLALISGEAEKETLNHDLMVIANALNYSAYLIANKTSWESKDLSQVVASIEDILTPWLRERKPEDKGRHPAPGAAVKLSAARHAEPVEDMVRLALPDGHQQQPASQLLNRAGIQVADYPSAAGNRRPTPNLAGVAIKVIRPQDMPLQVANGNFDLAITGRDWLTEHLCQFPSSPATELLDLKFGWVKIVAVVSKDLPAADISGLRQLYADRPALLRVASEYFNVADKYARENHLGRCQIVPTWGASEAFLPEDADLLIENTQTGRTIARHNLKIIDTLFESTACLIGRKDSSFSQIKEARIKSLIEILRAAVEGT